MTKKLGKCGNSNPVFGPTLLLSGGSFRRFFLRRRLLATNAGLSEPEIEDAGGGVTVRFRSKTYVPPRRVERRVTERQRAILTLLADAPDGLALREIVSSLASAATERQVRDDLGTLRVLGLAICEGRGRGARWMRL